MLEPRTIEAVSVKEYRPGEFVVREGDTNDFFYAILQGEIQIYQMEKPIRILSDRDVFGLENYYPSLTVVEVIASGNPHKSRKRISRPV